MVRVSDPVTAGTPNPGWPVFLYQQITYRFQTSTAYPGRIGLFRKVRRSEPAAPIVDEIVAPFDTSAKFRFFVLNGDLAQDGRADATSTRCADWSSCSPAAARARSREPRPHSRRSSPGCSSRTGEIHDKQ